ncbi:MAG: MFS transporter [Coxiellaceae bacterium]|jgi:PAT family beta-lactamase induction signal transducer AmpG|nr:MFS transporter [Coxiellaceae bacterium]
MSKKDNKKTIIEIISKQHNFALMCLSFPSGLVFMLIVSTLPIWLKDINFSVKQISYIFLISLPYSLKFLWAPLIDKLKIPMLTRKLGQKKSWILIAQIFLFMAMVCLAYFSYRPNIFVIWICAFFVALFVATQDSAIDGYRIDSLTKEELGMGTSFSGIGFRIGMLISGAGSIYLAYKYSWPTMYIIMSLLILAGPLALIIAKNPNCTNCNKHPNRIPTNAKQSNNYSYKEAINYFIKVAKHKEWFYIVLLIFLLKISDAIPHAMGPLFFMDLGFSKVHLSHAKFLCGLLTSLGAFIGGIMTTKINNIYKNILYGGFIQYVGPVILLFTSYLGYSESMFYISQGVQCFVTGLTNIILVTYLSSLSYGTYSTTRYTILYSFNSMSRIVLSVSAGYIFTWLGSNWTLFFFYTTLTGALFILPAVKLNKLHFELDNKNKL